MQSFAIRLAELVRHLPEPVAPPGSNPLVAGIQLDSRKVGPGDLFVAMAGASQDGHRFIPAAVERGAVAVVGTRPQPPEIGVPYLRVADGRQALAILSAALYRFPARQMTLIGVTGTDGKTTTANLVHQVLQAAGIPAGMISTVNALIGDEAIDTGFHVTTPEAPDVQRYLALMRGAGMTHVVLEATSHGLAQQRVAACDFDLGVVTNITHEHLDYHGTYEAYRAAKGLLFSGLSESAPKPFNPPRAAVLNRDDISFDYLSEITGVPQISYGLDPEARVRAEAVEWLPDGLRFIASGRGLAGAVFRFPVESRLVGEFNLANCLAAVATTAGVLGIEPAAVQAGIAALPGVPGRMERIDLGQPFTAIVDFAHTPNALRRALQAARALTDGKVIAVFGSAGLRDRLKRRLMAATSAELADRSVLTAEDPRTESLADILEEMAQGAESRGAQEGHSFWRVPDRREALRFAVRLAQPGDVVIACGKGHEQSMCFGEIEFPWDDRTALRAALSELLGVEGPAMPFLPE